MSRAFAIAFVSIFVAMSFRLLGVVAPESRSTAQAAATVLLIALVVLGVVEMGWGGGHRDS